MSLFFLEYHIALVQNSNLLQRAHFWVSTFLITWGSGKTTLLDMLLGRIEGGEKSGTICVNGKECNPGDVSRYVPQEDIFMGTMTVRETFEFR